MTTFIQENKNCEVYNGTFTGCVFTLTQKKEARKQKRIENVEDAKYEEL